MTLTSDRATKGLYEKYISMIKRVTTKRWGIQPGSPVESPTDRIKTAQGGGWLPKWWNILQIWNKKWWFKRMLANLFRTSLFYRYWWKQMADIEATLGPARKDDGKTSAQHINHSPRSASDFLHIRCLHLATILRIRNNLVCSYFQPLRLEPCPCCFYPICTAYISHVFQSVSTSCWIFPHSTSAVYLHILVEKLLYTSTWQNVLFSTWLQQVNLFYS